MDSQKKLTELVEIACMDGTWNWSPYFLGMANGLILALSVITNNEPKFLNAPSVWLKDGEKLWEGHQDREVKGGSRSQLKS